MESYDPYEGFRNPPGPITRSKLAKNVAKSVGWDPAWLVGPRRIEVNDLVLVRLDHVSKGSWQVHLQLLHPLRPR
ncbi:hypothetical protein BJV77DRAFT_1041289 [Russula vinacea]|nr:hypothetical protein BJV77DRAFT_1041289 [Russula vinacea]